MLFELGFVDEKRNEDVEKGAELINLIKQKKEPTIMQSVIGMRALFHRFIVSK